MGEALHRAVAPGPQPLPQRGKGVGPQEEGHHTALPLHLLLHQPLLLLRRQHRRRPLLPLPVFLLPLLLPVPLPLQPGEPPEEPPLLRLALHQAAQRQHGVARHARPRDDDGRDRATAMALALRRLLGELLGIARVHALDDAEEAPREGGVVVVQLVACGGQRQVPQHVREAAAVLEDRIGSLLD